MRIQPFGDSALLVTFENIISEEVNQKVISLFHVLEKSDGFNSLIPAFNSLTIGVNKTIWSLTEATSFVQDIINNQQLLSYNGDQTSYVIPACYDKEFGPDLDEVSTQSGLSLDEVIQLHTSHTYRVYMLGFVAGFAYMGSLPEKLWCNRKQTPRVRVPKGSIGLAGRQTGIYPTDAPGGWQLIGQTPLEMFNPDRLKMSLLKPGDLVRFRAVEKDEFKIIKLKIETGIFEMETIDE